MSEPRYLCHDCGYFLRRVSGWKSRWCEHCQRRRRVPTDPRLIVPTTDDREAMRRASYPR